MQGLGMLVKCLPHKYEDLRMRSSEATLSGGHGGTHLKYQCCDVGTGESLRLHHTVRYPASGNKVERSWGMTSWLTSGLYMQVHTHKHICTPSQYPRNSCIFHQDFPPQSQSCSGSHEAVISHPAPCRLPPSLQLCAPGLWTRERPTGEHAVITAPSFHRTSNARF